MKQTEIYIKLNSIFRDLFDDDSITINKNTTANDIEDWDSLEHINLIVAVEQEFGIKFAMADVISMKNVGDMVKIIESKLK